MDLPFGALDIVGRQRQAAGLQMFLQPGLGVLEVIGVRAGVRVARQRAS